MRDGVCTREARGRFDVVPDVRESALSSQHTARDRAMTRMIARALGRAEQSRAEQNRANGLGSVMGRIESAFIWRACIRTYVDEEREGKREKEREGGEMEIDRERERKREK